MPAAAIPARESERLAALREYEILDSAPEPAYDDLVQIASAICGTPVAAITLIDESRQWLKARIGLETQETTREDAFCAHTILDTAPLVVRDTMRDARFADNPLVLDGPRFRFYAGAPLLTPEGHALGAICVLDSAPNEVNETQVRALQALARHVVARMEERRVARQLAEALRKVELLSGLLPICSYCKRIRDDHDQWQQVEEYVAARTPTQFSHGICPTCLVQHFPQVPHV